MFLFELKKESTSKEGTYVAYKLSKDTIKELEKFSKEHDIPNPIASDKFHVTLVYSHQHVPNVDDLIESEDVECKAIGFELYGDDADCLVLKLKSSKLQERHRYYLDNGATHTYDEFKPHITLSYNAADFDISTLPKFKTKVILCEEYATPLDLDWKETLDDDNSK